MLRNINSFDKILTTLLRISTPLLRLNVKVALWSHAELRSVWIPPMIMRFNGAAECILERLTPPSRADPTARKGQSA
jgi:hypothetical protein